MGGIIMEYNSKTGEFEPDEVTSSGSVSLPKENRFTWLREYDLWLSKLSPEQQEYYRQEDEKLRQKKSDIFY
jgi:hypothetical protein